MIYIYIMLKLLNKNAEKGAIKLSFFICSNR
ncbi:hypothetical protein BDCR2A_01894 [Borrelia duttonii CR2A]|uniref:Uncharacterized protein n=1 Tax=Borrelia duttonii CR2A TaxID=1432657 RepID=W6TEY8_9SPIR|nr:hypothetical protein BDCR2A_01894 [Borrelia duttonii CR2A]